MCNSKPEAAFTGFPYLLTEEGPGRVQFRLLPATYSEQGLRTLLRRQVENLLLPATLVTEGAVYRRDAVGEEHLASAPALADPPHWAPIPGEVEFTESVDLFHRFRYFRAWYAYTYGQPLPTLDNPGFDRVRSFHGSNEIALFLALLGRDEGAGEDLKGLDVSTFIRRASWYDRLGHFWRQAGDPAWLQLLVKKSCEYFLISFEVPTKVPAAKWQLEFPALFDGVSAEQLRERLIPSAGAEEAAG